MAQFLKNDQTDDQIVDYNLWSMNNFLSQQRVKDKTLADCVEAILGCCVKSLGITRSFNVLKLFNILPYDSSENYSLLLQNKFSSPRLRSNVTDAEVDAFLINSKQFENILGYTFKDRAYLLQALTHPSYPTNKITGCYQQLEFLGDAVLDLLVSTYIFENCPNMNPGEMTDLRSALVNNITLACLCVRYNFHVYILSQNAVLSEKIGQFVNFQATYNNAVTEQVMLLCSESETRMGEFIDVPKALGDIFEAIIGAVFLDSGNNLNVTWNIVYNLMKDEFDKFSKDIPLQVVRRLYEAEVNPMFDEPVVEDDVVMVNLKYTNNYVIEQVQFVSVNALW